VEAAIYWSGLNQLLHAKHFLEHLGYASILEAAAPGLHLGVISNRNLTFYLLFFDCSIRVFQFLSLTVLLKYIDFNTFQQATKPATATAVVAVAVTPALIQ